jgi:DNA repair exonuclease SbcCD ATPase subunit
MKLKLKELHIQNFKGCKNSKINFKNRTSIYGQNGSGKTTIADAFFWVLFNKDSNGSTNFDIRPKDSTGADIDFIDIQVDLIVEVDGKELSINKTQKQKWVKKRGSEEKTFEGNESSYEVNTIPKSEKEFRAYIDNLISEDVFKFVSNTSAFMAQKPAERRETLFELVSEITDVDVLATDKKLLDGLSDLLAQFTVDELMSRSAKALKEYKKKLEEVPARIDEVSKTIVDIDYTEHEEHLKELKSQLAQIEEQIADGSKGHELLTQLKDEIASIKDKMADIERAEKKNLNDKRQAVQTKIDYAGITFNELFNKQKKIESDLELKKSTLPNNEQYLEKLGSDYKEEKVKELDHTTTFCPTCHQELPGEMKEELIKNFAAKKDERLLEINIKGKSVADSIKKDKADIDTLEKELEIVKADKVIANGERNKLSTELETIPTTIGTEMLMDIEEYHKLRIDLSNQSKYLEELQNGSDDDKKNVLIQQKRAIQTDIDNTNKTIAGKQVIESAKIRVEELKSEQKDLSQKIATVEKEIYLLEEFNKTKVNMLSEKINSHFKVVKWKLFERQINGGYKPVCEPLIKGQSYNNGLNSGHKILAELDIIATLQKIYEVEVPVFVDNAERINGFNIPDMDCQLITLNVSGDRELKVEVSK